MNKKKILEQSKISKELYILKILQDFKKGELPEDDAWSFILEHIKMAEKKTREKMAKALKMDEESWQDGMIESGDVFEGFNEAVRHFNRVLDNYIKKHE